MKRFLQISLYMALPTMSVLAQKPITFADPFPPKYDPSDIIPQFADVSPDITLPPGHIYFKPPTKQGWTMKEVMAKGVTHWNRGCFDNPGEEDEFRKDPELAKKEYYAVPRIREIFNLPGPVNGKWWPNGFYTEEQAREKGRTVSIQSRLWVGETMEGDDWVPSDNPMWGWFYDELIKRYEARKAKDGIPYYVAHNYFAQLGGPFALGHGKREDQEKLYDTAPETWPLGIYGPNATIGKPNTFLEGIYTNVPDLNQQQLLSAIMRMELMSRAGKYTGLFVFNVHEWRPGFASRIEYPDGIFYRSDKLPLDPSIQIALAFLSQEYGTIFIEWGLMPFQPPSKKPVDYYAEIHKGGDAWYPKGSTEKADFPYYTTSGKNRFNILPYLGDMTHFGIGLWAQTGAQVVNGKAAYATYKLDGKKWIERQKNGSDLVASYYEKRGVVRTRTLGRKMLICYFNMFADNEEHTIEILNPTNPGETFKGTVCGNGIHAVVVDIK